MARASVIIACGVAAALVAGPLLAQAPPSRSELRRLEIEKAEREDRLQNLLRNAEGARQDAARLQRELVRAAARREALERDAERQETRLIDLRRQDEAARRELLQDRGALEDVLAALIALERQRPPPMAVRPDNAVDAVRAAILLGAVAPDLESRAVAVARRLDRIRAVRTRLLDQNLAFRRAEAALEAERAAIAALAAQRANLEQRLRADAAEEQARLRQIAARAASLRELIDRVVRGEAGPRLPAPPGFPQRFAQARGQIASPTPGPIVRRFGADLPQGGRSQGVAIAARRGAQVVAPFDGRVEFSGPFRSYGRVLILNVGGDYHLVLAGMETIFVQAGQDVLAGEPIGDMPASGAAAPDLYLEVRRAGRPVDPAVWLAPQRERG